MQKNNILLGSLLLSLIWLIATIVIGGMTYPNYNHLSQFISELGATGAPYAGWVNYLGFVPTEIFMLIFIAVVYSSLQRNKLMMLGLFFLTLYAGALIVAAIYSCDFTCRPAQASMDHNLHMAFGMFAYLFAISGIILLSIDSKKWPQAKYIHLSGSAIGITALILILNFDPDSDFVGLVQRIVEFLLYLWFLLLAIYIYKSKPERLF